MAASLVLCVVVISMLSIVPFSGPLLCPAPGNVDVYEHSPGRCFHVEFTERRASIIQMRPDCARFHDKTSGAEFKWDLPKLDTWAKHNKSLEMIEKLAGVDSTWNAAIGLRRRPPDTKWYWMIDETPFDASFQKNWPPWKDQPSETSDHAVLTRQGWIGISLYDNRINIVFCESIKIIVSTTTTTTTTTTPTTTTPTTTTPTTTTPTTTTTKTTTPTSTKTSPSTPTSVATTLPKTTPTTSTTTKLSTTPVRTTTITSTTTETKSSTPTTATPGPASSSSTPAIPEGSTADKSKVNGSASNLEDDEFQWQWLVLGVCLTVALIGAAAIAGLCFEKRRRRRERLRKKTAISASSRKSLTTEFSISSSTTDKTKTSRRGKSKPVGKRKVRQGSEIDSLSFNLNLDDDDEFEATGPYMNVRPKKKPVCEVKKKSDVSIAKV